MTKISDTQVGYIKVALAAARESDYRYRLGAVIVSGGRVLGTGRSKYKNSPWNVSDSHLKMCSVHAEMDALKNVKGKMGRASLFVARLDALDKATLAKPCQRCMTAIIASGIKTIIWTIDPTRYGISKVVKII